MVSALSSLLHNLLAFGRLLRRLGLDVHPGRLLHATEALLQVDISVRDDFYHACRTCLVHRREDIPIFDRAFEAFWRRLSDSVVQWAANPPSERRAALPADREQPLRDATGQDGPGARDSAPNESVAAEPFGIIRAWSDEETLAGKDFAEFTAYEMKVAREALDRLVWNPGERRSRRFVAGKGPRIDLRRALARSVRTGGDLAVLARRRRRTRPRPLVLLCDVSGSMERYSRMLLHFGHALSRRHRHVEAFLFSTRLTRVTNEIRGRSLDSALAAVSRSVPDWSGGTRIGSQMARLRRGCHRLIWLNPLIGTLDYAPLTRGLQAALPYVDDFLPVRTLTNLADLAVHLNSLAAPARGGR
jgi:uncharacterized protein with von Willebrand factor type A (vWA) domain